MNTSKKRLRQLSILFAISFLIVGIRVAWFAASNINSSGKKPQIIRGRIEDTNGITLAYTKETSTIALAPKEIYDAEQLSDILSNYIDEKPTKILHKIYQKKDFDYFFLKRQMDNLTANLLMEKKIPGIHREYEFRRVYPGLSLASNLIGFVGRDQDIGLEGLELDYNELLNNSSDGIRGNTIQLTIDSVIQKKMDEVLLTHFRRSKSKRGVGIMLNLNSGEVLALSSMPNYNPNEYYKFTDYERGNWGTRFSFEPGSTVKILMAAILLNEKAISLQKKFQCDGNIHFGNASIGCRQNGRIVAHGRVNLRDILRYSCNVGIVKAIQNIKPKTLFKYLKQLGVGEATQIYSYGTNEISGYFPDIKQFVPSSMYYIPIGQSFTMTPIQLIAIGSSTILGTQQIQPYVLKRLMNAQKTETLLQNQPVKKKGAFTQEVSRQLREMLTDVVARGTGRAAAIKNVGIIGKTGTGEKSNATGYLDKYVVSFLGFFPKQKPRYSVLIVFDDPEGKNVSGGNIAAPAFREFVKEILPYLRGFNANL